MRRIGPASSRWLVVGFCVGLASLFLAPDLSTAQAVPPAATATLEKAREAVQKGSLGRAQGLYEKAAQQIGAPSFEVEFGLSQVHLLRGDQEKSLAAAQRALNLALTAVHKAVSLNRIGIVRWQLAFADVGDLSHADSPGFALRNEHLEQAEAALRKSIEVSAGQFPSPLFNLAEVFYAQGSAPEAKEWLERYTAAAPPQGLTERVRRLEACIDLLIGDDPSSRLFEAGQEDVTPPSRVSGSSLRYTEAARQQRIQGLVILQSVISQLGDVLCVRPLVGLPLGLSQVAIDAVGGWKFEPATFEGKPVPVLYNLTVNFKLR